MRGAGACSNAITSVSEIVFRNCEVTFVYPRNHSAWLGPAAF